MKLSLVRPLELDKVWLPPKGHRFDTLLATSYSLDEDASLELAMRFLPKHVREAFISPTPDTTESLKAYFKVHLYGKCEISYDREALAVGHDRRSTRLGLLAPVLREVILGGKHEKRRPRFHPKLYWALYQNEETGSVDAARIAISSQNMALSSQCVEAGLVVDFSPAKMEKRQHNGIEREFVASVHDCANGLGRSPLLNRLLNATSRLAVTTLSPELEAVEVFSPGTRRSNRILSRIPKAELRRVIVFSPFIGTTATGLKAGLKNISVPPKVPVGVITRQDQIDCLVPEDRFARDKAAQALADFRFGTLHRVFGRNSQELHGKIIVYELSHGAQIIVGSSNFTHSGWTRNSELNVWMKTRRPARLRHLFSRLRKLDDRFLTDSPGSINDEERIEAELKAWVAGWAIKWKSKSRSSRMPLSIVTTSNPMPDQGFTVQICSGTVGTVSERVAAEGGALTLEVPATFGISELDPLLEVRLQTPARSRRYWVLLDWRSYPDRKRYFEPDGEHWWDAVAEKNPRADGSKGGNGRDGGPASKADNSSEGLDFERFVVASLGGGSGIKGALERIDHLLAHAPASAKRGRHREKIGILRAIAEGLRDFR